MNTKEKIAVIGLGYVGLPVAAALGEKFPGTIGFDCDPGKIDQLREGNDVNGQITKEELTSNGLVFTTREEDLQGCNFFIVTVPTPVDSLKRPDLNPLLTATQTVGRAMQPGTIVVYESTVYPGLTEEICGPLLEKTSNLQQHRDFKLGYSPERINPGDEEHNLKNITKIVAAEDLESLRRVASVYGRIIDAGIYEAPSIRIAEAAKVIENTQRDINIALMNELSIIFDRLNIPTRDVLKAAETKWNFLPFRPGLVGGHCIGVDPYYLTSKAEETNYHPQIILAGRRINDDMGRFIVTRLVKLLSCRGNTVKSASVGVLGLAFKENIGDIRNSRVPDIINELGEYGIDTIIHDPHVSPSEAKKHYDLTLNAWSDFHDLDALILAVPHRVFLDEHESHIDSVLKPNGVLIDVKWALRKDRLRDDVIYWSL